MYELMTMRIQAWARTHDGMDCWLGMSMYIVHSIQTIVVQLIKLSWISITKLTPSMTLFMPPV